MTLIGKPSNASRTKFCFVYCGPERCDCGLTNLVWKHPPHTGGIEEKKDPFDDAIDVVTERREEK